MSSKYKNYLPKEKRLKLDNISNININNIDNIDNNDNNDFVLLEKDEELVLLKCKSDLESIYIEVTSKCNLQCITCLRRYWNFNDIKNMDMTLFYTILRQLEDFPDLKKVHIGGYGEPLMHPNIIEIVKLLKNKDVKVSISTNGTLLTSRLSKELVKANLDKIIISIDELNEDSFKNIRRGGNLDNIIENIRYMREAKKSLKKYRPQIELEFVMMKSNIDQVSKLPQLAKELGAPHIILTHLLAHSEEMYKEILYEDPEQTRYSKDKILSPPTWNKNYIENILPSKAMWSVYEQGYVLWGTMSSPNMYIVSEQKCYFVEGKALVVRADGKIAPCYALLYSYPYYIDQRLKKVKPYLVGDLKENKLLDIWNDPSYQKFKFNVKNRQFPSCIDCKVSKDCEYARENEDCWGNNPSCTDCLWSRKIIRCP